MTSIAQPPADDAAHILVVDDDNRIRTLLSRFLQSNGFRVTTAANAVEARDQMRGFSFDLLVLDVMMPGESGFDLAKGIRQTSEVPILMLTARGDIDDRLLGLEIGADDYLGKPFAPRELLLRINSVLRRISAAPVAASPLVPEIVRFGPYQFNAAKGELRAGEDVVRLTNRERDILRHLANALGSTVNRETLADPDSAANERTIDVQITRLRRKLEDDPTNPLWLQTVRGVGYRLALDGDSGG